MQFLMNFRTVAFAVLDNACKACVQAKAALGDDCPEWVVPMMHAKGHILASVLCLRLNAALLNR